MKRKKTIVILSVLSAVVLAAVAAALYLLTLRTHNDQSVELRIYPTDTCDKVMKQLRDKGVITDGVFVTMLAKYKSYDINVRSGRYVIEPRMRQTELVRKLANGLQTPVPLVVGKVRTAEQLAARIASQLMMNEKDLLAEMERKEYYQNIFDHVLPNTYEVYWNVSPSGLLERLEREADKWWQGRQQSLERCGLDRHQVVVLASIVEEETNKNDEKARIAGVYVNRLNKGMLLQADPTVKYAVGDFSLKRIRYKHLQTDSPYNTYMYKGLPPSAICLPTLASIEAVLNYERHDYLFFCAREDFSGYHNFACTPGEHYVNAGRYTAALNRLGIK